MALYSSWFKKAVANPPKDREAIQAKIEAFKADDIAARAGSELHRRVVTNTNLKRNDVDTCTFEKIKDRGWNMEAYNTIRHWTPEKQWGLMLWGQVGTGKTQLVKALMIHWADKQGTSGLFLSLQQLMNEFRIHLDDLEAYKHKLLSADILVIDDFGAEKTTEFVQVELLSFIDKRIQKGKSLFMTTNYDKKRLKEIYDIRILDRLQQLMVWVGCDGESYRRTKQRKIQEEAMTWQQKR